MAGGRRRSRRPGAGVVAVAEALVDFVPAGGPGVFRAAPGGADNVAVGLARQEVPTRLLARIADDLLGHRLRAHLDGNGVDLSYAVRAAEPTSLAIVAVGRDGVVEYDFRVEGTADWQWRDHELAGALDGEVVALHAGSLALTMPPGADVLQRLLAEARQTMTVTYDPNCRPLLMGSPDAVRGRIESLVALADVVKASADDLDWLLGPRPRAGRRGLAGQGPGPGGDHPRPGRAAGRDPPGGRAAPPGRAVEVVDTVGAGDACMAALLAGLHRRDLLGGARRAALRAMDAATLTELADEAVLAAAITCTRPGADPPTAADLGGGGPAGLRSAVLRRAPSGNQRIVPFRPFCSRRRAWTRGAVMRRVLRPIRPGVVGACLLVLAALVACPRRPGPPHPGAALDGRSLKPKARRAAAGGDDPGGEGRQMTQAERGSAATRRWSPPGGGSVLSGGGSTPTPNTPEAWADMVDAFQRAALATRLGIPLIYGVDSVHGHGNLVGATVFPHNIGLGATRDPGLVERIAHVTATETRATGPQWIFAPCVCVARDLRWGRTWPASATRAWSSRWRRRSTASRARGPGLDEPDRALATAKHYAGDGDTEYGTAAGDYTIDQGITVTSRRDFARIDLSPYVAAVHRHDVGSVMPSFASVDWTEDGRRPLKMHAHRELITGVLKGRIGFDGFVISDWEGIHQIPGDYATQVRTGVDAGIDMFMEPFSYQDFETTLLAEVGAGRVPRPTDDAVRRILTKKFELGLFERPLTDRTHLSEVGSAPTAPWPAAPSPSPRCC